MFKMKLDNHSLLAYTSHELTFYKLKHERRDKISSVLAVTRMKDHFF